MFDSFGFKIYDYPIYIAMSSLNKDDNATTASERHFFLCVCAETIKTIKLHDNSPLESKELSVKRVPLWDERREEENHETPALLRFSNMGFIS